MYGKIFDSIYTGTLYGQWQAIVTFQQMIVLCDADGIVDMTPSAIAAVTSIPIKIIRKGLEALAGVDPHSRTPGSEGRRIELIDAHRPWGWHIVNHEKYKSLQDSDMVRAQTRERVRKHRELKRTVTDGNAQKRYTDTDTDKNSRGVRSRGSRLPLDWQLPQDLEAWALQERPDLDPKMTADRFRDHWTAVPGQRGSKVDWAATWRNWVRNETDWTAKKQGGKAAWWSSDASIQAKGKELGLSARPGESIQDFKGRITMKIEEKMP